MTIRKTTLAGLPVVTPKPGPFPTVTGPVTWRYSVPHDLSESVRDEGILFREWVGAMPNRAEQTAVVLGMWATAYDSPPPLAALAEVAPELPALRHLFIGDMTFEECEISWINQDDYTGLLDAYGDRFETLWIRGTTYLELPTGHTHPALRDLQIESGGLPGTVVEAISSSNFPALERLGLWFGDAQYGADVTPEQYRALLDSRALSSVTHLGLANSDQCDERWPAIAESALLRRVTHLDLSRSTGGDELLPLLTGGAFGHLAELDVDENFFTDAGIAQLRAGLPGVRVLSRLQRTPDYDDSDRYVAVSE